MAYEKNIGNKMVTAKPVYVLDKKEYVSSGFFVEILGFILLSLLLIFIVVVVIFVAGLFFLGFLMVLLNNIF